MKSSFESDYGGHFGWHHEAPPFIAWSTWRAACKAVDTEWMAWKTIVSRLLTEHTPSKAMVAPRVFGSVVVNWLEGHLYITHGVCFILNKRLHVRISGKDPTDTQTPWMNVTEGPDYYAHAQTLATSWRHPTQKCTEHTVRFNGKIWRFFEINWRFDHRRKHTRHTESRRVWLNEMELYLNSPLWMRPGGTLAWRQRLTSQLWGMIFMVTYDP